jgi:hypothetical protein
MKNSVKILSLLLLVVVFACGLGIWAETSPVAYDYRTMHNPVDEYGLVFAFATALRINHRAAYDMIEPSLKPRLDEWMNTHQSKKCESTPDYFNIEPGTNQGSKSVLNCFGYNGWIHFEVDNIVIKDMKVIDWGEVTEDGD